MSTRAAAAALAICAAIGALCHSARAQGTEPVQVGYVIITPTFGVSGELIASETFGFSNGSQISQAGVSAARLSSRSSVFTSVKALGGQNLGIAIVNPSGSEAHVTLNLYRADGSPFTSDSITVPAFGQLARYVTELFSGRTELAHGFAGTLEAVSGVPVGITALRFYANSFSVLPVTDLSPFTNMLPLQGSGVGGPGALLLPHFASGEGWGSEIVLTNPGHGTVTVRVDIFDPRGNPMPVRMNGQRRSSFQGITLQPRGAFVLTTATFGVISAEPPSR